MSPPPKLFVIFSGREIAFSRRVLPRGLGPHPKKKLKALAYYHIIVATPAGTI
jgi:hypothetical protein